MTSTLISDTEPKKLEFVCTRKSTPHSRSKQSETAEKKMPTPRRRASPRNQNGPEVDNQQRDEQEQVDLSPAIEASNEDQQQEQEESNKTFEVKMEEERQPGTANDDTPELPPAQDTQLRRNYLQRIYRQLQSTHPNKDDAVIRQTATNLEMEICQKSADRSHYAATMEHEIHKLLELELNQTNASACSEDALSFGMTQTNTQAAISNGTQSGYEISQSQSYEYAQALAKAQGQEQTDPCIQSSPFSTPRVSMSLEATSFQSLMSHEYMSPGMQQQTTPNRVKSMQPTKSVDNPFHPMSATTPPSCQNFSISSSVSESAGQSAARNMIGLRQQLHMQQQHKQQPGSMRPQTRVTNYQEFSAQIQHLDKSVLIELLWNQRSALARWQNQAKQLALQLTAQRNATIHMGSPRINSSFSSPMINGGSYVNPNISAAAELQRARERTNARIMHQQKMASFSYGQHLNVSADNYELAGGNLGETQLYWERIRTLKAAYSDKLHTALRALAHNTAPRNSVYSVKAQSMMQNIGLVLNILNEQPTNIQPRKFDILNSIERFMQMSVIPIVQKVLSSTESISSASPSAGVRTAFSSPKADHNIGMDTTSKQETGTPCNSSQSFLYEKDTPEVSTYEVESKNDLDNSSPTMKTSRQLVHELKAVNNGSAINDKAGFDPSDFVLSKADKEILSSQTLVDQDPITTPQEFCTSSLPALDSHLSASTETQLSSVSPPGNAQDVTNNKVMENNVDDTLNAFSELADMDFDDPVAIVNNSSKVLRKRELEDV
ncbi:hypothetical protein CCR75_002666 [Bremia lactucae]|uniref:Mediator complex subunit 15 KIX domain-containing protein n=1 Tax=Bremia lactucae TaxID=4779 RepID=A0A976NY71_BRELC|nr:hypothetical protein CCR75_002666 [Bremia lactucae]